MLAIIIPVLAFTMPPPCRLTTFGDNSNWRIDSVSLKDAQKFMNENGDKLFFLETKIPQGWLALRHKQDTKLLMHYLEHKQGIASVTSFHSVDIDESAAQHVFRFIKGSENLEVDWQQITKNPKWYLTALYYLGEHA